MSRTSAQRIARADDRFVAYEPLPRSRPRTARSRRRTRSRPALRIRRIAILTFACLLAVVAISFASAMSAPSNSPFGIRAVEWLRDNGAAWLVSDVESLYYGLRGPSTGGAALKALPRVGAAAAAGAYAPPPIVPVIDPPLPGEGQWHGTGPLVRGTSPVLVTTFRPDPSYPRMLGGVAWIDPTRAWLQLYPGRYEPPGAAGTSATVPHSLRGGLLATFNSGFKLADNHGGFVAFGHVYAPLRDGQATLVRYRDGRADVVTWNGGPKPAPGVEFARQNLPLIVDGGRLNPNINDGPQWGATLGNAVRVWRSGIGVDAHGGLLYAAADAQTARSLAQILQRAGAVRAMELDINSEWVTFNFYGGFDAAMPQKLLPGMTRSAVRYLTPDDRDFFAVYARSRP